MLARAVDEESLSESMLEATLKLLVCGANRSPTFFPVSMMLGM